MHKQGDKISVHSDKWEFEARIHVRTVTGMGSSDIMEVVRVRNIPVYTTVNCPHENVYTVRYYQRRRTVVC